MRYLLGYISFPRTENRGRLFEYGVQMTFSDQELFRYLVNLEIILCTYLERLGQMMNSTRFMTMMPLLTSKMHIRFHQRLELDESYMIRKTDLILQQFGPVY
ncbi:uncharacterized protein LOC124294576 [Neodiprion lecontei]|uniref:Uncharacterized protein LOC124294576 n=1 Tax=Neodiprion lecontei TaxID=441921 RepID=A0ABM3G7X1_NEOLC|nr:uncharacterized protein LOC124218620 [Neodiprion pinetum]XP_046596350.1 uncharacterized protein LOC124294576 [Neodiprion lecontei]